MTKLTKISIILLSPLLLTTLFPSNNIENSYCITLQEIDPYPVNSNPEEDLAYIKQRSHKAMIKAIAKYKKLNNEKRAKKRQSLTLLGKKENQNERVKHLRKGNEK